MRHGSAPNQRGITQDAAVAVVFEAVVGAAVSRHARLATITARIQNMMAETPCNAPKDKAVG
jgi:dsRNA-specific ribonuclease